MRHEHTRGLRARELFRSGANAPRAQRAHISLKWVRLLSIDRIDGTEVLTATQVSGNPDLTVELRLRPEVSVTLIAKPKFP
jgi:hypothetical protein